ncbi:hypothetical protein MMC12_003487 [Toensbergia leucococca]|nr:hypothetical protein [Toensbergia leucococca]
MPTSEEVKQPSTQETTYASSTNEAQDFSKRRTTLSDLGPHSPDKGPLHAPPAHNPLDDSDPKTAALRAWAKEQELVRPGQAGTIALSPGYGMAIGDVLTFKPLPTAPLPASMGPGPPKHGTPEVVQGEHHVEDDAHEKKEKGRNRRSLSGFLHRHEKKGSEAEERTIR